MTTATNLRQRLDRIEAAQPSNTGPGYIAVASAADIPAALEGLPAGARFVKVYLGGISPDDWDNEP